ncbi:MAG TPA: GGDEF domain-containing protein [Arenimonas sp.]|uniref:GGDEF domain-containing protein n=1 Tax=Arenimonas sp. TaxID=1872635 RepID=UPI002CA5E983|nr:GGDEF domain-containing protein [Arenimonas sp.]HMB56880.1 GGDEF domain-containing protein [Arenimonas sp.]
MSQRDQDPITTQFTAVAAPLLNGPRSACVIVIHGESLGKRADIEDKPVVIGRSPEADLHIPNKSVSREHCKIWRDGDTYHLRDLKATNRTRVNDEPQTETELADGDHITLGESVLKFISHSSVEARYHEEVYQLATHDALTELYNRRHFIDLVDKEIARAVRHGRSLVMCIIDVDRFKPINDEYGHIAGDGVLRQISGLIASFVRGEDTAARIGGEEFAVMLPESDIDAALAFSERLREAVENTDFMINGEARRVTVSIGLAAIAESRRERTSLIHAADVALYRAKGEGRNRVCVEP